MSGFTANWYTSNIIKIDGSNILIAISIFISVCIGWIWWSFKIVKWKYWAFSKLTFEESNKLYLMAIESGLIWPSRSIFNKTEIWTKEDKKKWATINPNVQELFKAE
jgi:hypothetical protein